MTTNTMAPTSTFCPRCGEGTFDGTNTLRHPVRWDSGGNAVCDVGRTHKWTKLPCGHRVHHAKTDPAPPCQHCAGSVDNKKCLFGRSHAWMGRGAKVAGHTVYLCSDCRLVSGTGLKANAEAGALYQAEWLASQFWGAPVLLPKPKTPLQEMKHRLRYGTEWEVTNHFLIERGATQHPCYGTNTRRVLAVNGSSFTLSHPDVNNGAGGYPEPWPKAANVRIEDDAIVILGAHLGIEGPGVLFMTLRRAEG